MFVFYGVGMEDGQYGALAFVKKRPKCKCIGLCERKRRGVAFIFIISNANV